jgi:hypothetical protein
MASERDFAELVPEAVNMEEDAVNKHLVDSFVVDREKVIIII